MTAGGACVALLRCIVAAVCGRRWRMMRRAPAPHCSGGLRPPMPHCSGGLRPPVRPPLAHAPRRSNAPTLIERRYNALARCCGPDSHMQEPMNHTHRTSLALISLLTVVAMLALAPGTHAQTDPARRIEASFKKVDVESAYVKGPTNPFFPALRSGHRLLQRPSPGKQFPSI